jgi:hypothetical protein
MLNRMTPVGREEMNMTVTFSLKPRCASIPELLGLYERLPGWPWLTVVSYYQSFGGKTRRWPAVRGRAMVKDCHPYLWESHQRGPKQMRVQPQYHFPPLGVGLGEQLDPLQ